jgi:3-hydroxybutyryl-CoA dehydrogenase
MTAHLPSRAVVGVAGCGTMGRGIAQVALRAGHPVRLYDERPEAAQAARQAVLEAFDANAGSAPGGAEAASAHVAASDSMDILAPCALVIEAIAEDAAAKQELFVALEQVVATGTVLASNTSSCSITALARPLAQPQRLAGLHFFNPAPRMPLVEVAQGMATEPKVLDLLEATMRAWGKLPVRVRSTPGFIVNRVARPYYGEALRLLSEHAASAATLDAVMRDCGGFPMGPFELMDLIGLDVNLAVTRSVWQAFHCDPRYAPSPRQQELVDAGWLGRKSGRGFHRYDMAQAVAQPAGHAAAQAAVEAPCARPQTVSMSRATGQDTSLLAPLEQRLSGAGYAVGHRAPLPTAAQEAPALHCNGAAIYLTDGRSATERAAASGHADTVVFDWLHDAAHAPRIVLARADQCSARAWDSTVGLFQGAGFAVTRLDDAPGLAVMRTMAMLADEAAAALQQGVADAAAIELAMREGVRYPIGPLAWADRIGAAHVAEVLDNLARTDGTGRYRVAALLRRHALSGGRFHAGT